MSDQKPKIVIGTMVKNQDGKFLLVRCPKWQDKLVWAGGHVEWGETIATAFRRELKEETGLTISTEPVFVQSFEFVFSPDYKKDRHIIALDYVVDTADPDDAVKVDGRECTEYLWLTPEEILSRDDVVESVKECTETYLNSRQDYKEKWFRAAADYQNLLKETAAREAERSVRTRARLVEEYLPVYEHLKMAFATGNPGEEKWVEGIRHIMKEFGDTLKAQGVEEIKTVGEQFNPEFHEAIAEEEGQGESGEITKEVEGGYTLNGQVIKAAKVIVRK